MRSLKQRLITDGSNGANSVLTLAFSLGGGLEDGESGVVILGDEVEELDSRPEFAENTEPATLGGGLDVVGADDLLDGFGGLLSVVVREVGEEMVRNVSILDVMHCHVPEPAIITVNGGHSTLNVVPAGSGEVGKGGVGVLEEGDGDEPVVGDEIDGNIAHEEEIPTKGIDDTVEEEENTGQGDVGGDDEGSLLALEDGGGREEVVDGKRTLGIATARNVGEEVENPTHGRHDNEGEETVDEVDLAEDVVDLSDSLGELRDETGLEMLLGLHVLLGLPLIVVKEAVGSRGHQSVDVRRQMDLVELHITGVGVVGAVGDLPRVVGNEEEGVDDDTDSVGDGLGIREATVTTLVADDPETGGEGTSDDEVSDPERGEGEVVDEDRGRGESSNGRLGEEGVSRLTEETGEGVGHGEGKRSGVVDVLEERSREDGLERLSREAEGSGSPESNLKSSLLEEEREEEEHGTYDSITNDAGEGSHQRALEAMGGNSLLDIIESELGHIARDTVIKIFVGKLVLSNRHFQP